MSDVAVQALDWLLRQIDLHNSEYQHVTRGHYERAQVIREALGCAKHEPRHTSKCNDGPSGCDPSCPIGIPEREDPPDPDLCVCGHLHDGLAAGRPCTHFGCVCLGYSRAGWRTIRVTKEYTDVATAEADHAAGVISAESLKAVRDAFAPSVWRARAETLNAARAIQAAS